MPAFITHSLMFKGIEKKFNPPSPAAFYWGLQGPDLLFYCKFSKKLKTQLRIFMFGCSLHQAQTNKLYAAISKYIYKLGGKERAVIISYIEGFIAHNSLDYFAHPYVFYKEKQYMRDFGYNESALAHNKIESDIDSIMWQGVTGKSVKNFKIEKKNILSKKEKIYISKFYVYLVKTLLCETTTVEEILPCFVEAKFLMRVLTNESGLISIISDIAERKLGVKARGALSAFVRTENPDLRILNFEKRDWYNLNNKNQVKNDSFLEIYEQANMATIYEIRRFLTSLRNKVSYCPKKIGPFENGKLDI